MSELCKRFYELFIYDAETGVLSWRKPRTNRVRRGQRVGAIDIKRGGLKYYRTSIDNEKWYVHRIIMTMVYGEFSPSLLVDHINGDGLDNRISNLRFADPSLNCANHRRKGGKSGVVGVTWWKTKKLWKVRIGVNGEVVELGCFKNFNDAVKARMAADKEYSWSR